jgi:hypothetical protein
MVAEPTPEAPQQATCAGAESEIRHFLGAHSDHTDPAHKLMAWAYLAGRADLAADLVAGYRRRVHPSVVWAEAAESDGRIADRFGMDPLWCSGITAEQAEADAAQPPTLDDIFKIMTQMGYKLDTPTGGPPA